MNYLMQARAQSVKLNPVTVASEGEVIDLMPKYSRGLTQIRGQITDDNGNVVEQFDAVLDALKKNKQLKALNLTHQGVVGRNFEQFVNAALEMTKLEILHIYQVGLTNAHQADLLRLIEQHPSLRQIYIAGHNLTSEVFEGFLKVLPNNTQLLFLDFDIDGIECQHKGLVSPKTASSITQQLLENFDNFQKSAAYQALSEHEAGEHDALRRALESNHGFYSDRTQNCFTSKVKSCLRSLSCCC